MLYIIEVQQKLLQTEKPIPVGRNTSSLEI